MPSRVIINADDFGINDRENAVILQAFRQGIISSATLMANMPAFAEACVLAHRESLTGRVGLHVNLTHGRPLSDLMAADRLFCNDAGEFALSFSRYRLHLPGTTRAAIDAELEAQWQRCLAQGVRPTHIDSHQHIHHVWPVGLRFARFAAGKGVPLRLARLLNSPRALGGHTLRTLYKGLLNRRLRSLAGLTVDHVCTPADLRDQRVPACGTLELITHPCLLGEDFGDDSLAPGESLSQLLEQRLPGVPRVAYSALNKPTPEKRGFLAY